MKAKRRKRKRQSPDMDSLLASMFEPELSLFEPDGGGESDMLDLFDSERVDTSQYYWIKAKDLRPGMVRVFPPMIKYGTLHHTSVSTPYLNRKGVEVVFCSWFNDLADRQFAVQSGEVPADRWVAIDRSSVVTGEATPCVADLFGGGDGALDMLALFG